MRSSVDVHNYLLERDVPHEVVLARGRLRSPDQMAAVLDLSETDVGRVIVFEGNDRPLAVVVPAGSEADPVRVGKAAGQSSVQPADEARASDLTGYLPEAIPPAGLPAEFQVLIDESMAREDVLYFPGGEPHAVLKVRGSDLVRAAGAKVAALVFNWPGE